MEVNMLENIFTNMPAYQSEVVYKYGQITVKIKRCHIDEYSIDIDSENLDLYNRYTIFYSNFIDLKPRIEFDNNYKKSGYWYVIENNHYFEDSWENGDIFTGQQINCILNAVKNTAEFIERNGGTIINKTEITNIGKMVLKAKKVENDVYQCSIEGMKCYDELPHEYTENVSIIRCCVFRYDNRFNIKNKYYNNMYFSLYSGWYDPEYLPIENFKVTKKELDELKRLLQICSDNLHRINNTASIEASNTSSSSKKEKMKIKVTQTDNNKVILEIIGMKDDLFSTNEDYRNRYSKYKNGILLGKMSEYFTPDGCDIDNYRVILLGKDHPMTKKCANKIIAFLGASAAKLHAINHKDEDYELEL